MSPVAAAFALGPIALASRSPQRRAILEQAGIPFTVVESSYLETALPGVPGPELVVLHARGKARLANAPDGAGPVLGVDTVVEIDGDVLGKPRDRVEAERYLRRLSGRTHQVHSGLCLIAPGGEQTAVESTRVTFAPIAEADYRWYLDTGEWMERAGGYAIQGRGAALVSSIEGDYLNVVGLPLRALLAAMEAVAS